MYFSIHPLMFFSGLFCRHREEALLILPHPFIHKGGGGGWCMKLKVNSGRALKYCKQVAHVALRHALCVQRPQTFNIATAVYLRPTDHYSPLTFDLPIKQCVTLSTNHAQSMCPISYSVSQTGQLPQALNLDPQIILVGKCYR